jgi:hypothetical protein
MLHFIEAFLDAVAETGSSDVFFDQEEIPYSDE